MRGVWTVHMAAKRIKCKVNKESVGYEWMIKNIKSASEERKEDINIVFLLKDMWGVWT